MLKTYLCPVCGFPNLNEQPINPDGGGSYEICPSCGFQFGFHDDDRGISFKKWRDEWIKKGMPWNGIGISRPANWDVQKQLDALKRKSIKQIQEISNVYPVIDKFIKELIIAGHSNMAETLYFQMYQVVWTSDSELLEELHNIIIHFLHSHYMDFTESFRSQMQKIINVINEGNWGDC